jgi:hypothetical protein
MAPRLPTPVPERHTDACRPWTDCRSSADGT